MDIEEERTFGKIREAKKGKEEAAKQMHKAFQEKDVKKAKEEYTAYQAFKKQEQEEEKKIRAEQFNLNKDYLEKIKRGGKK